MANEKVFQSRIQLKHDIEENWLKAINFVPKEGEIIIYDSDSNNPTPRFKIGDGVTVIGSLPFVAAQADWNITDESDSGYIRNKPNYNKIVTDLEKLSTNVAYINKENNENIENPDIAASSIIIDSALSRTSANPVQNATITAELDTIKNAKADWNQNDETAIDYIKNRTFYIRSSTENILLDGTFEFVDGRYRQESSPINFEIGKKYIVIFDGASYNCIASMVSNTPAIGNGAIGNSSLYPDSGEPFIIGVLTVTNVLVILTNSAGTAHTVTIKSIEENIQTMDKKYLPIIDVAHGGTGRSTIGDTEYTTAKYRASALVTTETDPTDNGVIYWTYE